MVMRHLCTDAHQTIPCATRGIYIDGNASTDINLVTTSIYLVCTHSMKLSRYLSRIFNLLSAIDVAFRNSGNLTAKKTAN